MTLVAENPIAASPSPSASPATPIPSSAAGRLVVPPADAGPWVLTQIERGMAIRKTRIRTTEDLDKARARKGEWVKQTHDLLAGMFDNDAVATDFNTWDARVLPEYVDLKEFAEIFYDEMNQRLAKLKSIHRRIPPAAMVAPPPATVASAAASMMPPSSDRLTQEMPVNLPPPASVAPVPDQAALPTTAGQTRCLLVVADPESASAAGPVSHLLSKLGFHAHPLEAHAHGPRAHATGAFAVFLASAPPNPQMAYHLGFCAAKCGPERVLVLSPDPAAWTDSEIPVSPIQLDDSELWQFHLARQLRRAGVEVDMNRLC